MKNVIGFYDMDEFYWNINGTQWSQTFDKVTARVHVPATLVSSLTNQAICYAGNEGDRITKGCTVEPVTQADGSVIYTVTVNDLLGRQNLTFDVGFKKGTFVLGPEIDAAKQRARMWAIAHAIMVTVPILATLIIMTNKWRKYGKDPRGRGVIIPEYLPPKELNVLTSSYLQKESISPTAMTAIILELAVRKYITIYEIPKKGLFGKPTYELEFSKKPTGLKPEEAKVMDIFFHDQEVGNRVKLSQLKHKLYAKIPELDKQIGGAMAEQGYFVGDPKKVKTRYIWPGVGIIVLGIPAIFVQLYGLSVGLIISGFIVIFFSSAMSVRTKEGVRLKEYLDGLKDYMELAEADRIRFLQSPAGAEKIAATGVDPESGAQKVKIFEKLLPYALIFGIEKDWAKQFEDIYTQPPDWYHGNWSTFSTIHLVSSMGGFNTANTTSFSSPGSSGSSGFGGGGSSGGGGGGGGGGGW
jgi:uncharacterized membrane protein YgcG